MRAQQGTARRYAKALHAAAVEAGAGEATGRELGAVLALLEGSPQARDALVRPWIKPADRRALAQALAEQTGCGALVTRFAGLLADRRRIDHLGAIVAAYRDLVDADLGQIRADRKSTRLNSSHVKNSYAVFCLKKK